MSHNAKLKVWTVLQWLCAFAALAVFMLPFFWTPPKMPVGLLLVWTVAGLCANAAMWCAIYVIGVKTIMDREVWK